MTPPLELPPTAIVVPRWISVALGEIGVREDTRPGASHPRIEQYHAITSAGPTVDDVPWCSSFVCWCMEMAGIRSTKSKAASSWLTWGIQARNPGLGAIAVLGKSDPDAKGTGHVGFCLGISGPELFLLGGNQNQRVGIDVRSVNKVIAWRCPSPIELPQKAA